MEELWFTAAIWIGLALLSSLISIRIGISVALIEIVVGACAANLFPFTATDWINALAAIGAVTLTFLAGAEIDPKVIRRNLASTLVIGAVGFLAPYLGVLAYAHYALDWPWPQAQIAGIALSTTSVAVVYAVMVETGYNRTELGKIILAACFVNDVGTVLALGLVFANHNVWLALFAAVTALAMWLLPKIVPWFFRQVGNRVSEPETKFILLILFALGGLAAMAKSEAVLPAYLIGMVLAPFFLADKVLAGRIRVMTFTLLTPFYFLKAGSLVKFDTIVTAAGLIGVFLLAKMITKFVGILPLTFAFRMGGRKGMYTTLLMCTGLTFGSISALYGYTNGIIDQDQYTVLVTAVILSAIVPTIIAQQWFQPRFDPVETEPGKEEAHV
jgi:Kef-type K+ transport system membrane component KefB